MRLVTSGESHGPALVAILEGLPAGLPLTVEIINIELVRRQQGYGSGPRMKLEHDEAQILGGVMEGKTTGSPLSVLVPNHDHENWCGKAIEPLTTPRPGHADLTGAIKYGYRDLRFALERASARETAARVAVGAVCKHLLAQFGIKIGGYVVAIGEVNGDLDQIPYLDRINRAEASDVRCPEASLAEAMRNCIQQAITHRNTLGGIIEVIALGLPPGLGSYAQWDQRLDARLGAAILSVQAVKGVEIGPAFENARLPGTQAQDPICLDTVTGAVYRPTNRSGGVEGGITTGQPLCVRAAMKPIATTLTPQNTVDLANGQEVPTNYERSDYCPVPRAVPIIEAMVAFVLADALLEKLGGDSLSELLPRFSALRQVKLIDLPMDSTPHIFWPEESS
jgi:chorismate synthase